MGKKPVEKPVSLRAAEKRRERLERIERGSRILVF